MGPALLVTDGTLNDGNDLISPVRPKVPLWVYEVGGALKQALEGFDFLRYNLRRQHLTVDDDPVKGLRIVDNNMEHSISGDIGEDGFISINALASSTDKQDSFNAYGKIPYGVEGPLLPERRH